MSVHEYGYHSVPWYLSDYGIAITVSWYCNSNFLKKQQRKENQIRQLPGKRSNVHGFYKQNVYECIKAL